MTDLAIPLEKALTLRDKGALLIDARTPAEFAEATIPGAVNVPIFDDEGRARVGTLYKEQGKGAAKRLAMELVAPRIPAMVARVEAALEGRRPPVVVFCWRGGMRSGSVAWLLNLYGFEVGVLKGGYKAWRGLALESFSQPRRVRILGGHTGSGKTEILHALAARDQKIGAYRHGPMEFNEVASMSMELLGAEFIEEFYQSNEAKRARRDHLEGVVEVFPWIATVDAFQHWIYSHPDHSRAERTAYWLELDRRFGPAVDWTGLEPYRERFWQRQLHLFSVPLYYIEYGIAQLGALQLWRSSLTDPAGTVRRYRDALALGGTVSLPEMYRTAGAKLVFNSQDMGELVSFVETELQRLRQPD